MTIFDRYLLRRFLHVFVIGYLATFGLFVVIDGFTNVDSFQQGLENEGSLAVLAAMAVYYSYQSFLFFNLVGPILVVIAVLVVFTLLLRHSEIHPILSAGVPTYRLCIPLLIGAAVVNALLVANQELLIPRIASMLQGARAKDTDGGHQVEPVYDFETFVLIAGKQLFLNQRKMTEAEFVLPVPSIAHALTTLKADEAIYESGADGRPAGWRLMNVTPAFDQISLTPEGSRIVLPGNTGAEAFVVTDVSFDQLYNRTTSYNFISTLELVRRIKNPAYSWLSIRALKLHFHERLTRPLLNLTAVLLAVPFIVRKEHVGLVGNAATCTGVLALLYVATQAFLYMGRVNLIAPELAAWAPIILAGSSCAWCSELVQT